MNDQEWEKYAQRRRDELDLELKAERTRLDEENEENKCFEKADKFIKAIRSGKLDAVKVFLDEEEWDGNDDPWIFYRVDKNAGDWSACAPTWEEKNTTVLTEAVKAGHMNIVSYIVLQPKFETANVKLLSQIAYLALKKNNDEVLDKARALRKKVPADRVRIQMARENGKGRC